MVSLLLEARRRRTSPCANINLLLEADVLEEQQGRHDRADEAGQQPRPGQGFALYSPRGCFLADEDWTPCRRVEKEDTEADFLDKEASLISNIEKSSKHKWGSPSSVLSFRLSGEAQGEREQEDRHRNNVVLTLLTVVGGFWLLLISCLSFKFFGGKVS